MEADTDQGWGICDKNNALQNYKQLNGVRYNKNPPQTIKKIKDNLRNQAGL
jgi:hypothetical protein